MVKGLAGGCPAFKDGCPFKNLKDVGELKAKLGEMRDQHKYTAAGKAKFDNFLELLHAAAGREVLRRGHCPFFKNGCCFKTDMNGQYVAPETITVEFLKKHFAVFDKGHEDVVKGLGGGCPAFKNGCPFKNLEDVGELKAKLGDMRDQHKYTAAGKANFDKFLELLHAAAGREVLKRGHCPFFKNGCCFKTDMNGQYVAPETITVEFLKKHFAVFDKGHEDMVKGLGGGCPAFKDGCPFKNLKDVGELKAKLGEMRDQHKYTAAGKANFETFLELLHEAAGREVLKRGHCPFFKNGCCFKTDMNGQYVAPETITVEFLKKHFAVFDKEHEDMVKGLGGGCPAFQDGCPFKNLKDVGEIKAKLGEMRDQHGQSKVAKAKANKALQEIHKRTTEETAKVGHCSFLRGNCEFKTDLEGKPIPYTN